MTIHDPINSLDDLQTLLKKQIEMAKKGNYRNLENLAQETGNIIEQIVKTKNLHQPDFKNKFDDIAKLYNKLQLMLAGEKSNLSTRLKKITNVRKTLTAYSTNG